MSMHMLSSNPPRVPDYHDDDDEDKQCVDGSTGAAMKRFALLVDGMARAAILPFGPQLVHRLLLVQFSELRDAAASSQHINAAATTSSWSQIALPMAVVMTVYTIGRSVGLLVASKQHLLSVQSKQLPRHFARLGGLAFALHIFSYGAGLNSVRWLVLIRFLSALVAGFLCGVAADFALPEDDKPSPTTITMSHGNGMMEEQPRQETTTALSQESLVEVDLMEEGLAGIQQQQQSHLIATASEAPKERSLSFLDAYNVTHATAKIYMTGFACSILTGGLLYRIITTSAVLQALTGGYPLTLSPLFFVAVTAVVEFILKCLFLCSSDRTNKTGTSDAGQRQGHAMQGDDDGGPVKRFVRGVVNRRVRISNTTTAHSPDASSYVPHYAGSTFVHNEAEEDIEFHDPLSLSRHQSQLEQHRGTPNRSRLNSTKSETSMSEFFDCNSTLNDEIIDLDMDPHTFDGMQQQDKDNAPDTTVAVYKDGRCVYPNDGSPAFVPAGQSVSIVPQNYLDFYKGNHDKALAKYKETQEWRREKNVWQIHRLPHPQFWKMKDAYPHIIHGHSKTGQVVIYENPGKMNLKELFRSGCEVSDMLMHLSFFLEYVDNCVCSRSEIKALSEGQSTFGTMVVMDIKGASLSSLTGDVLSYLSQSGALQAAHYPNVLKRVFVVNCPFWLAGAYSTVKGIVPDSVHVEILSEKNALEAMRKFIDDDQIPKEYGGSSNFALGEHPYEKGCFAVAEEAGASDVEGIDFASSIPEEPILDASYSFDHSKQQWQLDERGNSSAVSQEVSEMIDGAFWRTELKRSSLVSTNVQPLRRRTSSCDLKGDHYQQPLRRRTSSQDLAREKSVQPLRRRASSHGANKGDPLTTRYIDSEAGATGGDGEILFLVSTMYTFWYAVQAAIETTLPLWIMSPTLLGGLGYSPSRSGMVLFCISIVLLSLMGTKVARIVSQIPNKTPMRAFRIAVGSEAVVLSILFLVPSFTTSSPRTESVLVMTSTIIFLSCSALASMLGRSGLAILHRVACENFARNRGAATNLMSRSCWSEKLLSGCDSGKFTWLLRLVGELLGILSCSPLYCWSTSQERPAPFDASCALFVESLVAFVLYVSSFSLHLNVVGEFCPHPRHRGCGGEANARKCCSFVGEVFAVSVGDMASLLEEANWSSCPQFRVSSCGKGRDPALDHQSVRRITKSV